MAFLAVVSLGEGAQLGRPEDGADGGAAAVALIVLTV